MHRESLILKKKELLITEAMIAEAEIGDELEMEIVQGEIRIFSKEKRIEEEIKKIKELKGCLGQEKVEEYDFELKMRRFLLNARIY